MPGVSLYAIGQDYAAAFAMLEECETPEDFEAVEQLLAEVVGRIEDKAEAYIKRRAGFEAEAAMCKAEIERLTKRAAAAHNQGDWLLDKLAEEMRHCNLPEVKAGPFTAKFQKTPPSVVIAPGTELPEEFLRRKPAPPPEPDKVGLKEAINGGREVPGVTLEQKEVLRIK